jgi:hypothetical protein
MTPDANVRLQTMKEFSELGAGFKLAQVCMCMCMYMCIYVLIHKEFSERGAGFKLAQVFM